MSTSKTQRWEWAIGLNLEELSDQHLQQAYRLNWNNLCKFDSCRKNCKRILCLACFDRSWIDNDSANINNYESFESTSCVQKRADLKSFVGLKNLGATCYVNCLLQLWFHNPALRKAIYEWDADLEQRNVEQRSDEQLGSTSSNNATKANEGSSNEMTYSQTFGTPTKRPHDPEERETSKKPVKQSVQKKENNSEATDCNTASPVPDLGALEVLSASPSNRNQRSRDSEIHSNPIAQLQLIFARLQFTNKKSIDPSNFIESLALNAAEQQDAQEFGNLFIEFLEKSFANQKNTFVSSIIKNQFMGRYSYATICDHCKHSSVSDSNFYELDLSIQNLDTLHDCLDEYFRPVPLDGKYNCSHCRKAQSAHRKIILKSLPPTLNLQLLRFVYDKQRNTRQKLNSFIIFPEIIDMSQFICESSKTIRVNPFDLTAKSNSSLLPNGNSKAGSNIYVLSAVLIHRGSSPHSGHYIAHIKDRVTKDWFKFNDDCVERIGPQLQVSTDGENISIVEERTQNVKYTDPASGKIIKLESKSLKSKTAYMLVYQAHDNEALTYPSDHSEQWELPDHLQTAVAKENSRSDEIFESLQIAREVDEQVMLARRSQIKMIYDRLVCRDPSEKFEFIDRAWLQNWLTNSSTTVKFSAIDNTHLLCRHDKLDFRKLDQVKCVRTEGADLLYNEFGGGPRLQDSMCRECVELEIKLINLKERMKEDQKYITSQAKFKIEVGYDFADAYIVGRNSYRDWQALAMVQFEKSNPELAVRRRDRTTCNNSSDEDENKNSEKQEGQDSATVNRSEEADNHYSDSDDEAIAKFNFNSDILCEHGQLVHDTSAWRIVPKEVWMIFKRYFDNDPERPLIERNANTIMCPECKRQEVEQQEIGGIQKQIAQEQKSKLPDLYNNRKRASWSSMVPGDVYYALDRQFFTKWQKFIRNPCNQEQPTQIRHSDKLICKHDLCLYSHTNSNPLLLECPFLLISHSELASLKELYPMDHEIKFTIDAKQAEQVLKEYIASHKSSSCKRTGNSQMQQLISLQHINNSGDSNSKSVLGDSSIQNNNIDNTSTPELSDLDSHKDIDPSDIDWSACVRSDPEYCSECHEILKQDELKRLLNYESATIYITKFENRTARRNRSRDHAYTIKPTQTLLELKKEIFHRCQVLPVDQRLFFDDVLLDDSNKTMAELRIVPNSSLKLEIDRPPDVIDLIEDEPASRKTYLNLPEVEIARVLATCSAANLATSYGVGRFELSHTLDRHCCEPIHVTEHFNRDFLK